MGRYEDGEEERGGREEMDAEAIHRLLTSMGKLGKQAREGPQFEGKVAATPTRELQELEVRMVRKFELYRVDVEDPRSEVQQVILDTVLSFLKTGGPAQQMYQDYIASWSTYANFIGRLYLHFQEIDAAQADIRAWNKCTQGNRPFMQWLAELERLWVPLRGEMGRGMFLSKVKEDISADLKRELAKKGSGMGEEKLFGFLHRMDEALRKEAKEKGKGKVEETKDGGSATRLPKEQWEKVKARAKM